MLCNPLSNTNTKDLNCEGESAVVMNEGDAKRLLSCPRVLALSHLVKLSLPSIYRGGKRGLTHTWMKFLNPSTSAKTVMTKLQNLFVALANIDIFQMTQKIRLSTVDFWINLCYNIVSTIYVYADMENACICMQCLHHLN